MEPSTTALVSPRLKWTRSVRISLRANAAAVARQAKAAASERLNRDAIMGNGTELSLRG
jgi:hypothetical protein